MMIRWVVDKENEKLRKELIFIKKENINLFTALLEAMKNNARLVQENDNLNKIDRIMRKEKGV